MYLTYGLRAALLIASVLLAGPIMAAEVYIVGGMESHAGHKVISGSALRGFERSRVQKFVLTPLIGLLAPGPM